MSKEDKSGNWFKRHKILSGLGVLVAIGIVASAAGGGSKPTSTTNSNTNTTQTSTAPAEESNVPADYKSALNQAKSYANTMHMSKQGVYDQLTSEYGGKFKAEAAQYAIDNVKADWNANALAKAKDYQKQQSLSPSAIRDQLVSAYGEKFTEAEADYAIQNLNN